MNAAVNDEILTINAIYAENTLVAEADNDDTCILSIPSTDVSLRLVFPPDYPDVPPTITGSESSGQRKGEATEVVELARLTLGKCFQPGEPCIYDLLEELSESLKAQAALHVKDEIHDEVKQPSEPGFEHRHIMNVNPQWILSEPAVEKKSVFLARAARTTSVDEAQSFITHLLTTDKKVAKATHNISAWRIRNSARGTVFQDCDDDGETAAGSRLLHLLQLMDVWNVVVVVSRWYGGVHLGPDRFRLINSVAREVLTKGNFE